MKFAFYWLILSMFLFSGLCLAQDTSYSEAKWTRIETENKDLSISFPPNFLVDTTTKDKNQRYLISGCQNKVYMSFRIYADKDAKRSVKNYITVGKAAVFDFTKNGFTGRRIISDENKFSTTIVLASKEYLYTLFISGDKQQPEIGRFLYSVKLNGLPLFVQNTQSNDLPEESISISSLKTSQEVLDALNRKVDQSNIKISFGKDSADNLSSDDKDKYTRRAIILVAPEFNFSSNKIISARPHGEKQQAAFIKIKITLLANGQIGEIKYLSPTTEAVDEYSKRAIIADAKKIKFIPAQINGKPVDSEMEIQLGEISGAAN